MLVVDEKLSELIRLPETERTRIALALLASLNGADPYSHLSAAEFRRVMAEEGEKAYLGPEDSMDWAEARALIEGSADK